MNPVAMQVVLAITLMLTYGWARGLLARLRIAQSSLRRATRERDVALWRLSGEGQQRLPGDWPRV